MPLLYFETLESPRMSQCSLYSRSLSHVTCFFIIFFLWNALWPTWFSNSLAMCIIEAHQITWMYCICECSLILDLSPINITLLNWSLTMLPSVTLGQMECHSLTHSLSVVLWVKTSAPCVRFLPAVPCLSNIC